MKIVSSILMTAAVLLGNEVERIESIVNDVTKLRNNYETCKAELGRMGAAQPEGHQKLEALQREIGMQRELYEREIERMKQELDASEKKIALLGESLQEAKAQIGTPQPECTPLVAEPSKVPECRCPEVQKVYVKGDPLPCPDPNPFPKLLMKEEYRAMKQNGALSSTPAEDVHSLRQDDVVASEVIVQKSTYFKACAFRIKEDAEIYDAPGGKVIATWEARTSFTSGERRGEWIRITGYFVERKWQPTGEQKMWVEARHTIKR